MVDSVDLLGDVVDECSRGASELVVECDGGGEAAEPGEDAFSDALEGAGAVAFEGEEVFAGPEDALDALSDRGEVRSVAGFVFAVGADDRRVAGGDVGGELSAGVAFVSDQRDRPFPSDTVEQDGADLSFVDLGEQSSSARGVPSGLKIACNRNPQNRREWLLQ